MPDGRDALALSAAADVARRSYGKLVAYLAARTRDVAGAEDALADALATALTHWPRNGIPDNPEAWLLAVARRKAIDQSRRRRTAAEAAGHVRLIAEELMATAEASGLIPDDRLALMFACAHPAIDANTRAPLILQTVLGFDATTIAAAFLLSPAAMGQRLARAKTKIRQAGIPFRVPEQNELGERLETVLEAIYATFAEGWSDPAGTDTRRRELSAEGIWLGRLVVSLLPNEAEALGLLALMLYAEARRPARRSAAGDYVPLSEQDTKLWDGALIAEAEALLRRASALSGAGRYQLEAAVQSAHALRRVGSGPDWAAIATLYDALLGLTQSPVVAINRAVAIAEVDGAMAALAALDEIADDGRLTDYQPYFAARADLLARSGDTAAAADAYARAMALEIDPAVRRFLGARRAALSTRQ